MSIFTNKPPFLASVLSSLPLLLKYIDRKIPPLIYHHSYSPARGWEIHNHSPLIWPAFFGITPKGLIWMLRFPTAGEGPMQAVQCKSSSVAMYSKTTFGWDVAEIRFDLAGRGMYAKDQKPIGNPLLRPWRMRAANCESLWSDSSCFQNGMLSGESSKSYGIGKQKELLAWGLEHTKSSASWLLILDGVGSSGVGDKGCK